MDALNMDTVCRLYEVGRQRLAEDEDEEEDQVSCLGNFFLLNIVYRYYALLLLAVGFFLYLFLETFAIGVFATSWHILKACHVSLKTETVQKKADFCYYKTLTST